MNKLSLIDSYASIILPGIFKPFAVFMLVQQMRAIPNDFLDAARIDGAGEFYIFLRIYCPLIVPGLITLGLFTFNSNYNNFLWPSIVLAPEQMTFGIVLREFQMVVSDTGALMAGALITCIPTFIIFLCGQKYFMENLAFTGIK